MTTPLSDFVFTDYGGTTLIAPVTTTPSAGTSETWTVASTGGQLPQITGSQVYPVTVVEYVNGEPADSDPEQVLVTAILSSTQVTVTRGYNNVVKTHAVGDVFSSAFPASVINAMIAAIGEAGGLSGENPSAWTGTKTLTGNYNGELLLVGANNALLAFDAPSAADQVMFISVDSGGWSWSVSLGSTAIWASGAQPSYTQISGTPDVIIAVPRKDLGVWALCFSAVEALQFLSASTVTNSTYTLASTDAGLTKYFTNSGGCIVTVPDDSTYGKAYVSGLNDTITAVQGAGVPLQFISDGTASVNGSTSTTIPVVITLGKYESAHLVRTAASTWQIVVSSPGQLSFNSQGGTTYTFALADGTGYVEVQSTSSSATTFNIPLNSSVPFPVGTVLLVRQMGSGALTVTNTSGTLHGAGTTAAQYTPSLSFTQVAANVWCQN